MFLKLFSRWISFLPRTRNGERREQISFSLCFVKQSANAKVIYADLTIRVEPRKFKQIFSIHVNTDGKVRNNYLICSKLIYFEIFLLSLVYPFAYALMNRKTRTLYDLELEKELDVIDKEFPNLVININWSISN